MKLNAFPIGIPLNLLFRGISIKKNSDAVCFYGHNPEHKFWKVTNFNFSRILLGNAEVINSARILDGISVRSPVRKAADTLQNVAFPTGFWKKEMTVEFFENCDRAKFCSHSVVICFSLKFCSHSSKIQRSAIFQSRILLTFLEKVEKVECFSTLI